MACSHTARKLAYGIAGTLVALPALAAEDNGGLPQLDFTTWPTQIFWLVVSFGLAYLLMWRIVTPAIGNVLEERHARVNEDMQRAKQAADEAEAMRLEFEARLDDARTEAAAKTRESLTPAQAEAEKKNAAASKRLASKVAKAEEEIAKARSEAFREIDSVATDGAIEAAKSLADLTVAKADADKAVKAAAKARPMAGE